jgi:preprotein translocase subunit SecE
MATQSMTQRMAAWPAELREFIKDLQAEMRRVTWPTRAQVRSTTLVVIVTVFIFAAYFFVVDFLLGRAITKVLDFLTK